MRMFNSLPSISASTGRRTKARKLRSVSLTQGEVCARSLQRSCGRVWVLIERNFMLEACIAQLGRPWLLWCFPWQVTNKAVRFRIASKNFVSNTTHIYRDDCRVHAQFCVCFCRRNQRKRMECCWVVGVQFSSSPQQISPFILVPQGQPPQPSIPSLKMFRPRGVNAGCDTTVCSPLSPMISKFEGPDVLSSSPRSFRERWVWLNPPITAGS